MNSLCEQALSPAGAAPVAGVVLAGGFSKRMGRDKALIDYHGEPHYLWTARLLQKVCSRVMISCRREQVLPGLNEPEFMRLHDEREGRGPITGILAAMSACPGAAVLAVACDLPRIDETTITTLLRARDPARRATFYISETEGLPEPLCAIYEPGIMPVLQEALAADRRCPRKILIQQEGAVKGIKLETPGALDNFNAPEDLNERA